MNKWLTSFCNWKVFFSNITTCIDRYQNGNTFGSITLFSLHHKTYIFLFNNLMPFLYLWLFFSWFLYFSFSDLNLFMYLGWSKTILPIARLIFGYQKQMTHKRRLMCNDESQDWVFPAQVFVIRSHRQSFILYIDTAIIQYEIL